MQLRLTNIKAAHEALVELVAEGKDELMEEYFEKGTIPEDHLISALHEAIRDDRIFPVLFASGLGNIATDHILDFLATYAPTAAERPPVKLMAANAAAMSSSVRTSRAVNQPPPWQYVSMHLRWPRSRISPPLWGVWPTMTVLPDSCGPGVMSRSDSHRSIPTFCSSIGMSEK